MKKPKLITLSILTILTIIPLIAFADAISDARQSALNFGTTYKDSANSAITAQNKSNTPGYTTDNPEQTKYYNGASTDTDAQAKIKSSSEGDLMSKGLVSRPKMTISPSDSFLNSSRVIEGNPDQVVAMLTGTYGECKPITSTQTLTEMRTCDQYTKDCVNPQSMISVSGAGVFLSPTISVMIPRGDSVGSNGMCSPVKHTVTTIKIQDLRAVESLYLSQLRFYSGAVRITVNGTPVYVSNYPNLFTADGSVNCSWDNWSAQYYVLSVFYCGGMMMDCTASPVNYNLTPNINLTPYLAKGDNVIDIAFVDLLGYRGGSAVFSLNYAKNTCGADAMVNECSNVPSDCKFQSSNCLAFSDQNICKFTQNLYACSTATTTTTAQVQCGSNVYCTNGQCTKAEADSDNKDFAKSISYLQALNQMGKDSETSADNVKIFTGTKNSCDKDNISYNNCCKDSGWGQDYLGASCKENEIALMKSQEKKLCHYVGSYCSKKIPIIGTCQTTTKSYCCFGSKISRVINEQGKAQLGISWGSGASPDCRGLTANELQNLKFDTMDLSEIASDIASQTTPPNQSYIEGKVKQTVEGYGKKSSD